jgi:hypothetical protein
MQERDRLRGFSVKKSHTARKLAKHSNSENALIAARASFHDLVESVI